MIDKLTADKIRKFYTTTDEVLLTSDFSETDLKDLKKLQRMDFIEAINYTSLTYPFKLDKFKLTPAARRELEEYDRALNAIDIAQKANAKSNTSNIIAWCALGVAVLGIIADIVFHCVQ